MKLFNLFQSKFPQPRAVNWYTDKIDSMVPTFRTKSASAEFTLVVERIRQYQDRYRSIEAQTAVPWPLIGCIHYREGSLNFRTNLANGQPWNQKTTIAPVGIGPFTSWEEAARDVLNKQSWVNKGIPWSFEEMLFMGEAYNGLGYYKQNRMSPYVWGGTQLYTGGQYVADGKYDPNSYTDRPGLAVLLHEIYLRESKSMPRLKAF